MYGLDKDDTPAVAVYQAIRKLLHADTWEFETVRLQLKISEIDLTELNFEKYMCCSCLSHKDQAITSSTAFEKIVLLLNDLKPHYDRNEVVEVEHLAWAITAINEYLGKKDLYLDYAPMQYIVKILHHEGFIEAPEPLGFVQDLLDQANHKDELTDSAKLAQESKCQFVEAYIKLQRERADKALKALSPKEEEASSPTSESPHRSPEA